MTIKQEHVDQASGKEVLGPTYFASRDIITEYMEKMNADKVKEIAKVFSDKIYEETQTTFETFLMGDAALNLHGHLYRMVDECVAALLGGDRWAFDKYVLGKYNCQEIRQAVAGHIPREVMDQRLVDLEKENERLRKDIEFYRERKSY